METKPDLLKFIEDCLEDTLFSYEPKNTKYTKRNYFRFVSNYDSCVLYVSKNRIIILNNPRYFTFSCCDEFKREYKINNKLNFIEKLQVLYNEYRFFGEHYTETNAKYSLITGELLK
jgi:hypothetical protein